MKVQQLTFPTRNAGLSTGNEFNTVEQDVKVIALIKGEERYVFLYSDKNRAETLRLLGRYASNPELSFTWYDAAVLSQKIRQESLQHAREKQRSEFPRCGASLHVDELF